MWRLIFKNLAYPSLVLRIITPPLIFVFNPLFVVIISLFLDWIDGQCWYQNKMTKIKYDLMDKSLDFYGYIFTLIYSYFYLPYFPFLLGLFLIRFVGQLGFYLKKDHLFFLYFPNLFEVAFLAILLARDSSYFIVIIVILFSIKLFQEYFLHKMLFSGGLAGKMPEIFRGPLL